MDKLRLFSFWGRLVLVLWAGWVGLLSPAIVLAAGQSNSHYVIDRDVVNAGGTTSTSTTYTLTGSIGQTSPLGSSSNPHDVLYAGFWHGKAYTLSVAKSGTGTGTVKDCRTTTDCPGDRINCGPDCLDFYTEGDHVLLQAAPDAGSSFVNWLLDGAPITEPLSVTRDLTITAVFQQIDVATLPFYAGFDVEQGQAECDPTTLTLAPGPMPATAAILLPSAPTVLDFSSAVEFHFEYQPSAGSSILFVPKPAMTAVLLNKPYNTVGVNDINGLTIWPAGKHVTSNDTVIFLTPAGKYVKVGHFQEDPNGWTVTFHYTELL